MTAKSRTNLATDIATLLDNTSGLITPVIVRTVLQDIVDSVEVDQVSGVAANGQYLVGQPSGPPAWQSVTGLIGRPLLTGNATYYIRTDGSDSNSGLADSSGSAWLTWAHATAFVQSIDFNGFTVTLQHGNEGSAKTFTATISIGGLTGGGILVISGSPTAGHTIISTTGDCIDAERVGTTLVEIQQVTLQSSGLNTIQASYITDIILGSGVVFGPCPNGSHMYTHDNQASILALGVAYSIIAGNMAAHATAVNGGHVYIENCTVTLTGIITFSAFVQAQENGVVQSGAGTTWNVSGATITGAKFAINMGGAVNSLGDGISFFPGSMPGQTSQGGNHDGIDNSAWKSVSVTPAPSVSGSFGSASATFDYSLPGGTQSKTMLAKVTVVIGGVGSATGTVLVPLPSGYASPAGVYSYMFGLDRTSGAALIGILQPSSSILIINTIAGAGTINVSTGIQVDGVIQLA